MNEPPKIAAVVCLTTGDSTLLGFNRKYGWGWPGGKVEANELIEEAAVRELREETSIVLPVERLKLVGVFQHTNDVGAWAAFLYVARVDPSLWVIQNCEPEKFEDWKWAPWDKAIEAVRADTHEKWTMHEGTREGVLRKRRGYQMAKVEKVLTVGGMDPNFRQQRLCKCAVCGVTARCTPDFDFFGKRGEPLQCQPCFVRALRARGIEPWNFGEGS